MKVIILVSMILFNNRIEKLTECVIRIMTSSVYSNARINIFTT